MILDMLQKHLEKEKASFHMPGHKNGVGMAGTPFQHDVFTFDTTELPGTDALIAPESAILEAEQFAAGLYGAKHSFFLVNGSTGGILSMIFSAFRPDDIVIVDRNCHQAVLNGLILSGARPVFVAPEDSALEGVPGVLTPEAIKLALSKYPNCKGAIITSPNYYGAAADIQKIADVLHGHHAILLVDEAHGAHFPFSEHFPKTAMEQGADMSVTSLHKTLSAPNQSALLHISKRFSVDEVRSVVRMFQTSSPSYVLLAAMEASLHFAFEEGETQTEKLLGRLTPLSAPTLDDPCKLLPGWFSKGISGNLAEQILREKFGIYAELSNEYRVLLMSSWFNSADDFKRLEEALSYLGALPAKGEPITFSKVSAPTISAPILSPADVHYSPRKLLPIEAAEGHICSHAVSAFPPCIPVILPGEKISAEQISDLTKLIDENATITGLVDEQIFVVEE